MNSRTSPDTTPPSELKEWPWEFSRPPGCTHSIPDVCMVTWAQRNWAARQLREAIRLQIGAH